MAPTRLPTTVSSFVGRVAERAALDTLVDAGARLVTLVGPGGAGKTRLAIEWARTRQAELGDRPVLFCDLTEARTLEGVCYAVAGSLGLPLARGSTGREAPQQVGAALGRLGPALILLDNFEQVVGCGAATVGVWLGQAPEVTFVATSRSPLELLGEQLCDIGSLNLPIPGLEARRADAVQLFVDRARAVRPGYQPSAADEAEIAVIVAQLDGLPLAIELAAARMRVLGARQIAAHLATRFELCGRSLPGAPARHATLRAAIDWSWELLEPSEQSALVQAAVFRGGFDLRAAEAVLLTAGTTALDVVQGLCERSLAQPYESPVGDGVIRYRLYESVREYAAERLARSAERAEVERRHDAYYHRLAVEAATLAAGRGRAQTLALLGAEVDNLLAASEHAAARGLDGDPEAAVRALELAVAFEPLALGRGPLGCGLVALDRALAAAAVLGGGALGLCARASLARGHILAELGRSSESLAARTEALDLARRAGDQLLEGRALASLAHAAWHRGELDSASALCEQALRLHRSTGDRAMEGRTLGYRASAEHARGWVDEARVDYQRALDILRSEGDRQGEAVTWGHLARLEHDVGRVERARISYTQAIDMLRAIGDRYNEATFVAELGHVALELGEAAVAHGLYERALAAQRQVGNHHAQALALTWLGRAAELEAARDRAREHYDAAVGLLGRDAHPLTAGLLACFRGRLAADSDDVAVAERLLADGAAELARAGSSRLAPLALICRAHLDAARARRARSADEASEHLGRAQAALELGEEGAPAELRLAVRALRAQLDVALRSSLGATMLPPPASARGVYGPDSAACPRSQPSVPNLFGPTSELPAARPSDSERPSWPVPAPRPSLPPDVLWVSATGRAFRVPGAEPVQIATRGPLRRVLAALADLRQQAPGQALSRDALVGAGWPGERLGAEAAAGRVYAAIATLRRMGLRELLQRQDDGYLLDAQVPFSRGSS